LYDALVKSISDTYYYLAYDFGRRPSDFSLYENQLGVIDGPW